MADLRAAAKAFRAAQDDLPRAEAEARGIIRAARDRIDRTRAELQAAMVAEAHKGTPQVEIVRISGYSRERVRSILREGGVEP